MATWIANHCICIYSVKNGTVEKWVLASRIANNDNSDNHDSNI